nr:MAG TPA: hypothetical protein [Bacteriophage sp.]
MTRKPSKSTSKNTAKSDRTFPQEIRAAGFHTQNSAN